MGWFKQILKSIPMVPLVATTSIMTIFIMCFMLILTNPSSARLKFASATLQQQQQQQQQPQDEEQQAQPLHIPLAQHQLLQPDNQHQEEEDQLQRQQLQPQLQPQQHHNHQIQQQQQQQAATSSASTMARKLALKQRELLDGLFINSQANRRHQENDQQEQHHLAATHRQTRKRNSGTGEFGGASSSGGERGSVGSESGPALDERQQQAAINSALGAILLGVSAGPRGVAQSLSATKKTTATTTTTTSMEAPQLEQDQHEQRARHQATNHERLFDVAQIQCNNTDEGFERFACPTPDFFGRYRCIEDRLFCDGYYDCPNGEDEERVSCMYYKLFASHIEILTNTFLTWMKNQNRQTSGANNDGHYYSGSSQVNFEAD